MPSPKPILSKASSHPYPFQIPARSSSTSHLPLSSAAADEDEHDEDIAQERARNKLDPKARRRVSFDLNAVLHPPSPAILDDDEDEEEEEEEEEDDRKTSEPDLLAPRRKSSLFRFSSQQLATQSSPDLLQLSSDGRPSSSSSPPAPARRNFRQRLRLSSSPSIGPSSSSSPRLASTDKKPRKISPIFIRAPLPAKAKVARRHALAQRHAAALELMLCGPSQPEPHVHHAPSATPALPDPATPEEAAVTIPSPPAHEPKLKPAKRWSRFPRLHLPSKANDTASPASADAVPSQAADADLSTESATTAEPEALTPATETVSAAPDAAPTEKLPAPETTPVPLLKRLPLLRRVSPSSNKQAAPSSSPPSALTPKQIRALKAALMDMDLANGIIGELRARSLDPLNALLQPGAAPSSTKVDAAAHDADGDKVATAAAAGEAVALQPQTQPRCVLGPLLPPVEIALAAAAASGISTSASGPLKMDAASLSSSSFAGAKSAHERGASGEGGSRDDSALPDHLDSLREEDEEAAGSLILQHGNRQTETQALPQNETEAGESAQPSAPVPLSPPVYPQSAARRSLAQILNRIRPRTTSSPTTPSAAELQESGGKGLSSGTAAVAIAAVAAAGVAGVAASGSKPAAAPAAANVKKSSTIFEQAEADEKGKEEEEKEKDNVAPLSITAALGNLSKINPPKIMGMSSFDLATSPQLTIATEVASTSGAFDALADLSSAALAPSLAGTADDPSSAVGFPIDRLSFVVHWWGYEVLLPPLAMAHLSTAQSVSSAFLSFLQTMAMGANLPELLPFIKYISTWVELEFRAIRDQDTRGGHKGVVLAATWVMPMALVPRPWDYPVGTQPALPSTGADAGNGSDPSSASAALQRLSAPSSAASRNLRNRLDGPPVPAKDGDEFNNGGFAAQPRFPSARPSFPTRSPSAPALITPGAPAGPSNPFQLAGPAPASLPIPVRF